MRIRLQHLSVYYIILYVRCCAMLNKLSLIILIIVRNIDFVIS